MVVVAFIVGELAALVGVNKRVALIIYMLLITLAVTVCYGLFFVERKKIFTNIIFMKMWDKVVIALCCVSMMAGYVLFDMQAKIYEEYDRLQYGEESWINVSGKVISVQSKQYYYKVELDTDDGIVQLQLDDIKGIKHGYMISATGTISPMGIADNPGNYDERSYLHGNGVILKVKVTDENYEILGELDDYSVIDDTLYNIKQKALDILSKQCEEKEMGLLSAIVLGDKTYMSEEMKELYSSQSVAHVTAVSGLHVSVIGMGLYSLMRKRMRYISSAFVSAVIMFFFSVFTGNSVSAIRAVIMFIMHVLADVLGRKYDMLSAIAFSALVALLDNPFYITNTSFILSYLAMIAVTVTAPIVIEYFKVKKGVVKTLLFNISLTLTSLPINSCLFYRLSTYSILLNLMVVPLLGILLVMAIIGMFVSAFSETLGAVCLGTSVYVLRFYEWLCNISKELPASSVVTGSLKVEQMMLYYCLLVVVLFVMWWHHEVRKISLHGLYVAFMVISMIYLVYSPKVDGFELCFLDVGQGDCAYIHSPTGNDYLIDCGSTDEKNVGKYKLESFLEYRDVEDVEYAFISHCDTDHMSGIVELIERGNISVKTIVLPMTEKENPSENGTVLIELAMRCGTEINFFGKGSSLADGELEFVCVSPDITESYADINEASLVMFMRYDKLQVLFAGDIGVETESLLLEEIAKYIKEYTEKSDISEMITIYKVAHHGSQYSTSEEMLDVLKPDIAIISCGENNSYGHPHRIILERLEDIGTSIFISPECGAVIFKLDEDLSMCTWKNQATQQNKENVGKVGKTD